MDAAAAIISAYCATIFSKSLFAIIMSTPLDNEMTPIIHIIADN
jgi:hypothetical protein